MKSEFCNQDVINEAASKIETPKFLLKKIEAHWHKFVHKTIIEGNFENVLIPYFVIFEFNKKKMDAINYAIAKSKEKK